MEGNKKLADEIKKKEADNLNLDEDKKIVQAWNPVFDKDVEKMNAILPFARITWIFIVASVMRSNLSI